MSIQTLQPAAAYLEAFECEREDALTIQRAILPHRPLVTSSFEIAHEFRPVAKVAGDFLDYFFLPDGRVGIYMGDVVGKGLSAALFAALVVGTMRGVPKTGAAPASVLELANRRLERYSVPGRFCAAQYAVFDPEKLELRFANAGLPRPLRISPGQCDALGQGGLPLGLFPDSTYEEYVYQLASGEAVLFATDGLQESWSSRHEQLGVERLGAISQKEVHNPARHILTGIFDAVAVFTRGAHQEDDVAAVVLKLLAP
jgi:sigma-B regulation protein RsbU (phosphoserine phosphatase)